MQRAILTFLIISVVVGVSLAREMTSYHTMIAEDSAANCNTSYTCVGKGETCTGDLSSEKVLACLISSSATCCSFGLYCINSTCSSDNVGGACQTNSDCHAPLTAGALIGSLSCVSSVCTYSYQAGDTCSTNADCSFGLTCTSSKCQGLAVGTACTHLMGQCAYGSYCAGVCTAQNMPGQTCQSSLQCYPGSTCVSGTCKTIQTVPATGACNDDLACESGLVCAANNTCITAQTSLTTCANSTECSGTDGFCMCSLYSGITFCEGSNYPTNGCTDENVALTNCLATANCTEATDAPESCCYLNCASDYKKTFSCSCSMNEKIGSSCYYNQYCGGFPVWAIIVIIVVAIVLVLAIVLLVFFMMRRRRHYDSI